MLIFFILISVISSSDSYDWGLGKLTSPEEIVLNRLLHDGTEDFSKMYADMDFFFPSISRKEIDRIRTRYMNDTVAFSEMHTLLKATIFDGSEEEIDHIYKECEKVLNPHWKTGKNMGVLQKSLTVWAKYCIVPLKRGDKSKCYRTEKDAGFGLEEVWMLSPDTITQYLRDELVKAHDARVAKFGNNF